MKSRWTWWVGLILLLALLACGSADDPTTAAPVVATASGDVGAPTTDPGAAPAVQATATSAPVAVSGPQVFVLAVEDNLAPGRFHEAQPDFRIVGVKAVIDNTQNTDVVSINALNGILQDSQGLLYTSITGGSDVHPQIDLADLRIGERIAGWFYFEIPTAAVPTRFQYTLSIFDTNGPAVDLAAPPPALSPVALPAGIPPLLQASVVEGISLAAQSVTDPAPLSGFYTLQAGTRLVVIEALLRNESAAEPVSSNALYFYLVDDYGFVYGAELGASSLPQIDLIDLGPTQAVKGNISFELPEGRQPAYIRYGGDIYDSAVGPAAGVK